MNCSRVIIWDIMMSKGQLGQNWDSCLLFFTSKNKM